MSRIRCTDAQSKIGTRGARWHAVQWLLVGLLAAAAGMLSGPKGVGAFEDDIHYDVTFAIALADSWTWEQARTIAGADQAPDENAETEAGVRVVGFGVEPKPQNFHLHGFSQTDDTAASNNNDRNQDVKDDLVNRENTTVNPAIDTAKNSPTEANKTKALTAIGVYLHDQADSWSHSSYGGKTFGHALDTARDSIFNRTNPDHPARRPIMTRNALEETLAKLSSFQNRWKGTNTDITNADLDQLIRALTDARSLELTDSQRKTCNRELSEHWLYLILKQKGKLDKVPQGYEQDFVAPTDQAFPDTPLKDWPSCKDIHDAIFTGPHDEEKVAPPNRKIPKLDQNGAPRQVNEDGTFKEVVSAVGFNHAAQQAVVRQSNTPSGCSYQASVAVSNSGPEQAPPAVLSFAVGSTDGLAPRGQLVDLGPLNVSQSVQLQPNVVVPGTCPGESLFMMNVEPPPTFPLPDVSWDDWDVSNDSVVGLSGPVGGIAELPKVSGSSGPNYVVLAAAAATTLLALTAGAWYTRRRWGR